jgi:hypothetical protein
MVASMLAVATPALAATASRDPYARLFTAQLNGSTPSAQPSPVAPSPKPPTLNSAPIHVVVCGMTVMQGDATIDAAMAHHPPANAPAPVITLIQPATCSR